MHSASRAVQRAQEADTADSPGAHRTCSSRGPSVLKAASVFFAFATGSLVIMVFMIWKLDKVEEAKS